MTVLTLAKPAALILKNVELILIRMRAVKKTALKCAAASLSYSEEGRRSTFSIFIRTHWHHLLLSWDSDGGGTHLSVQAGVSHKKGMRSIIR